MEFRRSLRNRQLEAVELWPNLDERSVEKEPDYKFVEMTETKPSRPDAGSGGADFHAAEISICRPLYNEVRLDWVAGFKDASKSPGPLAFLQKKIKCKPLGDFHWWMNWISGFLPVLYWLPDYNFKRDFIFDLISGITVAIVHVPQGMAYGEMAGATPSNGLYTAFFPGLLYFFLGTSRHNSLGVFAIVSLMVSSVTYRLVPGEVNIHQSNLTHFVLCLSFSSCFVLCWNSSVVMATAENVTNARIQVVASLAFFTGVCTIIMGLLHFEAITSLISSQVSGGFTTAAGIHVLSNQLSPIFGIRLERHTGVANLFYLYRDLFLQIANSNRVTVLVTVLSLMLLLVIKEFINPLIGRRCRLKIPIPGEIIVVILVALADYLLALDKQYAVAVVGPIPVGLPRPTVPDMLLFPSIIFDAVVLSIVIYSVSLSLSRTFSDKHNYKIDPSQEFYAFGIIQVFVSFFTCQPPCAALGRTMVLENSGGRSQLASIISSLLILSVIFFFGRYMETLPKCVLSAIICVALKGVFLQCRQLCPLWQQSKWDFAIWMVAFVAVLVFDVSTGLFVGICFAFLLISVRAFWVKVFVLGNVEDTEIYLPKSEYSQVREFSGITILKIATPLIYLNAAKIEKAILRKLNLPERVFRAKEASDKKKQINASGVQENAASGHNEMAVVSSVTSQQFGANGQERPRVLHFVILDMSAVSQVDLSGVQALKQIDEKLKPLDRVLFFACCNKSVEEILSTTKVVSDLSKSSFPTVIDAVSAAESYESLATEIRV